MGRIIGTKCKYCRRHNERLCMSEKCALTRRQYPPGIHGPKGYPRLSQYGIQLREKQRARIFYGLMEKQFYGYYKKASLSSQNTGEELLRFLERRLDNVIYRSGFATTRAQARQLVGHCHIVVNGKKMNIPSYSVKKGDVITLREKSKKLVVVTENIGRHKGNAPDWIEVDVNTLSIHVLYLPTVEHLQVGIDSRLIVEFYSR